MKYAQMMAAAAVLAGAMAIGCDAKDQNKTAATPTHDAPNVVPGTNTTPDTASRQTDTAMQNAGAQMKALGQNAKDATKNATDAMSTEAQKLKDKMSATTMPTAQP